MIGDQFFIDLGSNAVLLLGCLLFFYALLGKPLFAVIGGLALLLHLVGVDGEPLDLTAVFAEVATVVDNSFYVTIPLFVMAGMLLAESQAPTRFVRLASSLLGWMPGGLAVVSACVCAFFTAFTGASGVTIVALGGLLYPVLLRERYGEDFSIGLLTTGGSLGLLFPPSLPVIVYGLIAGVDIDTLFIAGIVPGMLLLGVVSGYGCFKGHKLGVPRQAFSLEALRRATWGALWEIPIPIIVVGGIYSGAITATEASAMVAFYCLIVEVIVYRDIKVRALPTVLRKTAELVGAILVILIMALGLKNYLIDAEIPQMLLALVSEHIHSPITFLLVLNGFLIIVGCLLDIFSATMVVVPLIAPLALQYGIDPIHLGIVFLTNLEIGYLTPPVGINLFLSGLRFNKPILTVARQVLPFLFLLLGCLALITYVPWLSTFLVDVIKG